MRGSLATQILNAHAVLPQALVGASLKYALSGLHLALCLHRVRLSPRGEPEPSPTVSDASELDALVELLLLACPDEPVGWLTLSFDDGYLDAVEYVRSRHARWPKVKWLLFVCPRKLTARRGFRWDLPVGSSDRDPFAGAYDVDQENTRADLSGLADRSASRLATVEDCRRITELPRVTLGNHTNCHFRQTGLSLEAARRDLFESRDEFEGLFGKSLHFAFPFGTKGSQFTEEHVALAREAGYRYVWSTEPRPFHERELESAGALARVAIFGDWPTKKSAAYIALHALHYRIRAFRGRL